MADERVIKRYTNRKLYDKLESRYVTLEEIARLVRAGEDIRVVDNETEEDLTAVTFAQIILEEEKRKKHLISVPFLRKLIRSGEVRVQDLSDRATRSIEAIGEMTERAGSAMRGAVEEGSKVLGDRLSLLEDLFGVPQKRLDAVREGLRKSMDKMRASPAIRKELERVAGSLRTLEEAIARIAEEENAEPAGQKTPGDSGGASAPPPTAEGDKPPAQEATGQTADSSEPSVEDKREVS